MAETKMSQNEGSSELHSLIREFHGESHEMNMCLGNDCPTKDCRICPAAGKGAGKAFYDEKGRYLGNSQDSSDSYRASVKKGYYSSTVKFITDPETGETKGVYIRPPD